MVMVRKASWTENCKNLAINAMKHNWGIINFQVFACTVGKA